MASLSDFAGRHTVQTKVGLDGWRVVSGKCVKSTRWCRVCIPDLTDATTGPRSNKTACANKIQQRTTKDGQILYPKYYVPSGPFDALFLSL